MTSILTGSRTGLQITRYGGGRNLAPGTPRDFSPVGPDHEITLRTLRNILVHLHAPASGQAETASDRFARLAAEWRAGTGPSSFVRDLALHPSYQEIIGMGRGAIPLILGELERRPNHWFWALRAITGVDPVSRAHRGDLEAMTEDWLRWGKAQEWIP